MDRSSKIKATLKNSLRPKARDSLFPTSSSGTKSKPSAMASNKASQECSERVTLPLAPDQKDLLDDLGKKLQRQRKEKLVDFNRNTIIRALIGLLNESSFDKASVNTEEELNEIVRLMFRVK